ncbi:immunoglobulin domain-containing protein [Anguilla rostrata]|uniref:Transmembrane protein PVRIG immunoglobulin-like domain-containing protein n=1 Tax=Anguilla anguilla TaxID=7936 RepID=A0A0E9XU02_ANGAN|nr:uncharacterized protein si:ch211-196f2.6 [Anguilla anguilla]KAG5852108.1 hypothetical protein ANANG_G00058950 [Anguilla anguilla]
MRKDLIFSLLVLTFLKTGKSKSRISIFQRLEDGELTVTCNLLSEDKVTQINWEMVMGQNRSKLGILHPQFGTHVYSDHKRNVKIESSSSHHTTSLKLIEADMGNSTKHCCLFITFPSGNLEACADFTSTKTAEAPELEAHIQTVTGGWWKWVAAVTVVTVLTLIVAYYLRRRYYNSRREVFQVEQAFLTDPQTDSQESRREQPQSSPQKESSEAFDPSKLYAKIKIDYYYGRLWKAYESNTRGWTKGPQPKIYHLLGEKPPQQKDNEEPQQG